jgi:DNA-binding XRE family transcriptional regulator
VANRKHSLREARELAGIGRERTAAAVGVSAKTLERWEKANRAPRHRVVELAGVYGLELEQLDYQPAPARTVTA